MPRRALSHEHSNGFSLGAGVLLYSDIVSRLLYQCFVHCLLRSSPLDLAYPMQGVEQKAFRGE